MTFEEYQAAIQKTKTYSTSISMTDEEGNGTPLPWVYPALGLSGEAGEILEKFKKIIRDQKGQIFPEDRENIKKELGDVLWYCASISDELGINLDDVAQANIDKLYDRLRRDKISGSGDNR